MRQCPRRTVLGGIGTTLSLAVAGTAVTAADDESAAGTADGLAGFDSVREFLPASVTDDEIVLQLQHVDRLREADDPNSISTGSITLGNEFGIDPDSVSRVATVNSYADGFSAPITVVTGDVEFESDDAESRELAGVEYDHYEADESMAAATDDVVVIADDTETIEAAFEASTGEGDRLLESDATLEEALEIDTGADGYMVRLIGDEELNLPTAAGDASARYVVHTSTVLDPDTLEVTIGIAFEDESAVTDELVEALEGELAYMATTNDPTAAVDGALVTVTVERDLEAARKVAEHDSPGFLRADRDVDPDDEYLEIELGRGDPTPVEDLTLEVGGEAYDRDIWTDGHGTLEEGDTIVVDMDDVEPNLSVRLEHDHELGSSASETTILNNFRFAFDYDVDSETVSVTYEDEFPLDGDDVSLATHDEYRHVGPDEDAPDPNASTQPWEGETLSKGDTGTLEGVEAGDRVIVGWQGTTHDDAIGQFHARPPGSVAFEYDYESETLSATLEFDDGGVHRSGSVTEVDEHGMEAEADDDGADVDDADADESERDAGEYELRLDGDPAGTQWSDEHETVTGGETIELEGVPVGADVEVVWGEDARVAGTQPKPTVELELVGGDELEHVGGDPLAADKLEADVWADVDRTELDLGERIDGDFEEGDTVALDVDNVESVTLQYDGDYYVGHAYRER